MDTSQEAPRKLLTRRTFLIGTGATTAAGALALSGALPAQAAAPTSPADVITLAKSYNGNTRADMDKIWSSKYVNGASEWCALFVSWCLRGTPTGFSASSEAFYNLCTPVSAANVRQGDIVWYYDPGHIGLVRSHSDGDIRTVEGNAGSTHIVKEYDNPWGPSSYKFARPKY